MEHTLVREGVVAKERRKGRTVYTPEQSMLPKDMGHLGFFPTPEEAAKALGLAMKRQGEEMHRHRNLAPYLSGVEQMEESPVVDALGRWASPPEDVPEPEEEERVVERDMSSGKKLRGVSSSGSKKNPYTCALYMSKGSRSIGSFKEPEQAAAAYDLAMSIAKGKRPNAEEGIHLEPLDRETEQFVRDRVQSLLEHHAAHKRKASSLE